MTAQVELAAQMTRERPREAFQFAAGPVSFAQRKAPPAAGRAQFGTDLAAEARKAVAACEDDVQRATERLAKAKDLLRAIEGKTSAGAAGFTAAAPLLPPPFARKPAAGITPEAIREFQATRPGMPAAEAFERLFAARLPLPRTFSEAGAPAR